MFGGAGIGERECTYRLQDDSTWTFSRRDRAGEHLRWAHLDHLTLEPA